MKCKYYFYFLVGILLLLITPLEVFARAGGGGSSGGVGIFGLILYPFFLIYTAMITHQVIKKNKQCRSLLEKLQVHEEIWDTNQLRERVQTAFYRIQDAWMNRNQMLACEYMSLKLFEKHKMQTDLMIENHEQNIMRDIELNDFRIVDVEDYKQNSKDVFWICYQGSMFDYIVDDRSGNIKRGKSDRKESFRELWKYIVQDGQWVVDEIKSTTRLSDLGKYRAYSENIE